MLMKEEEEIKKYKEKIKGLEEKAKRKQLNSAIQFFKKNKIDYLLGSPEELKKFIEEVMPIIKKYQQSKKEEGEVKEG